MNLLGFTIVQNVRFVNYMVEVNRGEVNQRHFCTKYSKSEMDGFSVCNGLNNTAQLETIQTVVVSAAPKITDNKKLAGQKVLEKIKMSSYGMLINRLNFTAN